MEIIIDTREQKPLEFTVPTIRECLPCGDYRAKFSDGSLSEVVFERKSINDLYGTLSAGYERFKKELGRASEAGIHVIIIVERSLRRVLRGCNNSQRTPISIVYQLFTIRIRYGIETVFSQDRDEMSTYITNYYLAEERHHNDKLAGNRSKPIRISEPGIGEVSYTGD